MKRTDRKGYARIAAAVDPDPVDTRRDSLNADIMTLASSLARMEGSELHVVHGWRLFGETILLGPGGMNRREVDGLARKERMIHKSRLTDLVTQYAPGIPADRIHLLKGEAKRLIPALVRRKKIDLLVMGTVWRTGIAVFIIGSTAETVLREVGCSVLAIKPEGFVTPVKVS